jgi:hypothetical protein
VVDVHAVEPFVTGTVRSGFVVVQVLLPRLLLGLRDQAWWLYKYYCHARYWDCEIRLDGCTSTTATLVIGTARSGLVVVQVQLTLFIGTARAGMVVVQVEL